MTLQAVLYARVSTDEQAKGYSLQTQFEAGRKYAVEKGYVLVSEFLDDYTGASLDRPGLNQLRAKVAAEPVNVVIVYDVDRLARKSVYQMIIEEELAKHGARVEYVLGQYADNDEGRLQKQIRSSIAEYEKAKILERSKRGKRGKAQSGYVVVAARPPYGYCVKREPHKSWLEIDEEEARIVRLVFDWYLYGDEQSGPFTMVGVAIRLTALHVLTRGDKQKHVAKKRGAGVWTCAMIRHILTNETYTGIWHYGKTKMISDGQEATRKQKAKTGLGKQVARPREEWVAVTVPAIIDRSMFDKAQARMKINAEQAKRNTKREYLLGRRLRCAKCGYTYVGITRREKNKYYVCHGVQQVPIPVCNMPSFRVDLLDYMVWEWVKEMMQHPERLAEGVRAEQAEAERINNPLRERLAIIAARLAETEKQLARLIDLYLVGEFPKDVLTERKLRLEKDKADLTRERAELGQHIKTVTLTEMQITEIETFCAEVRAGLDHATFADKRRYFDLLDVRGTLALENNEKVIYIQCKLGQQRRSVALTSHLSNTGVIGMTICVCQPTPHSP